MKRRVNSKCKALLTFVFFLFIHPVFGQEVRLNTPLQLQCSKEAISHRDSILNYMNGVAGTGFIGKEEWIGLHPAKRQWGGPWQPLDGYKHTLCGYMGFKKNAGSGKAAHRLISDLDGDAVFFVVPDPAFRWLQFKSLRPQGHQHKDFSLSCEIAIKEPGNTIATDAATYLKSIPADSLQFRPVGVYGPWVTDVYHDNSPEIHPVQQIWRSTQGPGNRVEYELYSLFDNSNRFTGNTTSLDSPAAKPWMPVPLVNIFYLPFSITINDSLQFLYDIKMPSSHNINVYPRSEDKLSLFVNGALRITVLKPAGNFPAVTVRDVCQVNENTIHGYVAIETSVGKPGDKSGAHAILKVLRSTVSVPGIPVQKPG